ncbi:MAG: ABC transporter permease [Anaerolineales bacterium]|jgi:ABC-2 type transport system permease protein|uniref:ABC transporter permease n=1 Tax=Candidatus Villigracilis affinis TaxID=3140682 RepID=UPI001D5DA71A|nr:ABC transporter permease [Anaerolineales bacterium]MBK9603107.1 ABC transporter permease [Anaerolineales bacterium]MBL0346263.1 ABC transporter permease [Anaerolineales bacterium]
MEIQTLSQPTLSSHLRALSALIRKDWKQYWRYPLNAVSSVFQPLIWIAPIYFMGLAFSVNGKAIGFSQYSGTTDFMSFILLGTVLENFINAVFWGMGYALKNDMDSGVMESNWLTPIPRLLILVGHSVTNLLVTMITSAGMLLFGGLLFGFHASGDVFRAFIPIIPMMLGLYGFGFAFAAVVMLLREANALVDMSSFLVQIFSGSNFPVNALPKFLLPIALALPLTYGLDAIRHYLIKTQTIVSIQLELLLLVIFMFVMLWIGITTFRSLEKRVRTLGTLGQH